MHILLMSDFGRPKSRSDPGGNLDFGGPKSGFRFAFDRELDGVQVGLALTAARDLNELAAFEFLDKFVGARDAHAHVVGKPFLAGKAMVVVPCVAEEHGVDVFGAHREIGDYGR